MRLLGASKASDLNMQHVSNLFGKRFPSRLIGGRWLIAFLLDQR